MLANKPFKEASTTLSLGLSFALLVLACQLHASMGGWVESAYYNEFGLSWKILLRKGEITEKRKSSFPFSIEQD